MPADEFRDMGATDLFLAFKQHNGVAWQRSMHRQVRFNSKELRKVSDNDSRFGKDGGIGEVVCRTVNAAQSCHGSAEGLTLLALRCHRLCVHRLLKGPLLQSPGI